MNKETAHMVFTEIGNTGKTKRILVRAKTGGTIIGNVSWYSRWRRYIFAPAPTTIFDAACMEEITSYLDALMQARGVWR